MDRRTLPWLAAIIVFSAIAFALGDAPLVNYLIPFAAFLAIFFIIQARARR